MLTVEEKRKYQNECHKRYYRKHREEYLLKAKIYRTTMSPEKYEKWREQIRQSYYRRKAEKQK